MSWRQAAEGALCWQPSPSSSACTQRRRHAGSCRPARAEVSAQRPARSDPPLLPFPLCSLAVRGESPSPLSPFSRQKSWERREHGWSELPGRRAAGPQDFPPLGLALVMLFGAGLLGFFPGYFLADPSWMLCFRPPLDCLRLFLHFCATFPAL